MFSYQQTVQLGEERQEDFRRAAKRERLIREVQQMQPSWWDRALLRGGDWLIAWGQRLKARRALQPRVTVQLSLE